MKVFCITLLTGFLAGTAAPEPAETNALRLVQTIPLPNVEGRIDYFGVDILGQSLFVSALGNNTLEVVDLREGKRLTAIRGLSEPKGVFFVPSANKIFVANGADGTCRIFDGSTYRMVGTMNFSGDADNVRYDASHKQIYVGYGQGALGILDGTAAENSLTFRSWATPSHFASKPPDQGFS